MSFAPMNGGTRSTNGNGIRIIIVMSAADELLQNALAAFRGGQLESALALYKQALASDPANFTALYMSGAILLQAGKPAEAETFLRNAILVKRDAAEAHNNLGLALTRLAQLPQAIAAFREALRLRPHYPNALLNLGNVLRRAEQLPDAIEAYESAIALSPDDADIHYNLAGALESLGEFEKAIASYRTAISKRANFPQACNNLGNALATVGRFNDALTAYTAAIAQQPNYAEAYANRASVRFALRRFALAKDDCDSALKLNPHVAVAYCNRSVILRETGDIARAIQDCEAALAIDPDYLDVKWNLALTQLLTGDWKSGWDGFELRFQKSHNRIEQPMLHIADWVGEPIAGKRILIYCEQGLGDTIQFVRFALVLQKMNADVVIKAPESLVPMISSMGLNTFSDVFDLAFDYKVALMSIPRLLGITPSSIAPVSQYLNADPGKVALWKSFLPSSGVRVGISWQGNPLASTDRGRSIPLAQFEPLARLDQVHLVSLQKGPGTEQIETFANRNRLITPGEIDNDGAFTGTAAIIQNLDLVVTSDTSIAHLAGALGKPVWVALKYVPDWRWLLDRTDSPWYPSARLYRQTRLDDWTSVFDEIAADLKLLRDGGRQVP
jgi:tetratricopeptide (TPR) repeat protein